MRSARRRITALAFALTALCGSSYATAQEVFRLVPIPERALYGGRLTHVEGTQFWMNGQAFELAPGVTIHDTRNLMVLPGAVPPASPFRYITDLQGNISRIWLLTESETELAGRPNIRR